MRVRSDNIPRFTKLRKFFEHSKEYVGHWCLLQFFTYFKRSSTKFKDLTENLVRYYDLKVAICSHQKFGKLNKVLIDCNHFTDFDKS